MHGMLISNLVLFAKQIIYSANAWDAYQQPGIVCEANKHVADKHPITKKAASFETAPSVLY